MRNVNDTSRHSPTRATVGRAREGSLRKATGPRPNTPSTLFNGPEGLANTDRKTTPMATRFPVYGRNSSTWSRRLPLVVEWTSSARRKPRARPGITVITE